MQRSHPAICSIGLLASGGAALAFNKDRGKRSPFKFSYSALCRHPSKHTRIPSNGAAVITQLLPLYKLPLLQYSTATRSFLVITSQGNDRVITRRVLVFPRTTLEFCLRAKSDSVEINSSRTFQMPALNDSTFFAKEREKKRSLKCVIRTAAGCRPSSCTRRPTNESGHESCANSSDRSTGEHCEHIRGKSQQSRRTEEEMCRRCLPVLKDKEESSLPSHLHPLQRRGERGTSVSCWASPVISDGNQN